MTHSTRIAAITNNKRIGDDIHRPAILHRIAYMNRKRNAVAPTASIPSTEQSFRERTA